MELAILNVGYADGYLCRFSNRGRARLGDGFGSVIGRVSMDLTAISVDDAPQLAEGDWVELDFDLPSAAGQSGLSQYRSEEHTSELQSLMRTSYAVFCLKNKNIKKYTKASSTSHSTPSLLCHQ